ncbi:hypothetical protein TNCV_578171 [Trichonephila clavipes]|nr:hypothetical protein TNCV_578171 [Trichonephila clavipes]
MMDTLGEEALELLMAPIFNSSLDLIIVEKPPSLQSFLEWTEVVVYKRSEVHAIRGMFEKFLAYGISVTIFGIPQHNRAR